MVPVPRFSQFFSVQPPVEPEKPRTEGLTGLTSGPVFITLLSSELNWSIYVVLLPYYSGLIQLLCNVI